MADEWKGAAAASSVVMQTDTHLMHWDAVEQPGK